ncbi:peptidase [Actinosynnema pretiosum subsp. pretiosum]|uniref:Peptidase n=2 Tax=Actinosynnema TaxID=40566 RepID=C6WFM4_ACTMD|nr:peptidase [Actinosynnema mirum]ACU35959.1 hypothetical protein Amir_2011 [Actinosynnema mirum DSM 43827]AXX29381.1 hypothetical protein APASM_2016 [Actinosynnema pretiosum subsp. pretiosum]QUF06371.1 peptidase [Actinosynnema pretiosum subsp. pretiosum]
MRKPLGALAIALLLPLLAVPLAQAAPEASDYWTPDRMRAAAPLDLPTVAPSDVKDVPAAPPAEVAPQAIPNGGGPWTGGGAVVTTAGRVFFSYQGRTASCSGNAVTSANKSTVITAGHCVKLDGAYHTNVVFVPAYDNGATPYGTWTARATYSTPQWNASEDINYDVGAIVVNQLDGRNLTDVVGGQGIAFNQPKAAPTYAFGYPAADPYDGTRLVYCSGTTFNAFLSSGIGLGCDMTGGASGGPWFHGFSETTGTGTLISVNSYKIVILPFWMFGPYFGADAQNLYNQAQAA